MSGSILFLNNSFLTVLVHTTHRGPLELWP